MLWKCFKFHKHFLNHNKMFKNSTGFSKLWTLPSSVCSCSYVPFQELHLAIFRVKIDLTTFENASLFPELERDQVTHLTFSFRSAVAPGGSTAVLRVPLFWVAPVCQQETTWEAGIVLPSVIQVDRGFCSKRCVRTLNFHGTHCSRLAFHICTSFHI